MKTKIMLRVFILINLFSLLSVVCTNAQQEMSPDSVASKTLNSFRRIITQDNYKLFGLKSPDEISNLRLGSSPIHVFMIRLDSLRQFRGGDGISLLIKINQVIFPVYSNNILVSSIKLIYSGQKWKVQGFGNREIAQKYFDALKKINVNPNQKTYLIRVPSLNISLLAIEDNTVNVQFLGNEPVGELRPGETVTLQSALSRLKPIAIAYNGLPL